MLFSSTWYLSYGATHNGSLTSVPLSSQAAAKGTNRPVYCESRYYQAMAGGGLCD